MRKLRVPISNFQFGEVSPSLISRTDSQVYQNSAQKVENFFLRAEGGIIKRMGLKNIYEFDTTVDTSKVLFDGPISKNGLFSFTFGFSKTDSVLGPIFKNGFVIFRNRILQDLHLIY